MYAQECARVISSAVWGSLSASQASNLSLKAVAGDASIQTLHLNTALKTVQP